MGRKKTFAEVKTVFEKRGYELLETEYTGQLQKMKFKCPKHSHLETKITFKQLSRGEGCRYCGIEKVAKAVSNHRRKWTIEDVKDIFAKKGCELLENEYISTKHPIKYKCKCGSINKTSFRNYKRSAEKENLGLCRSCSSKIKNNRIWTHETASKYFENQGCKLISVYVEQNQRLKYICKCGNQSYVKLSNFINGNRCKECANNRRRLDYEYVKTFFEEKGCTLLTTDYRNKTRQKLDFICSCGNKHSIRFLAFQRGERCPKCSSVSKGEKEIILFLENHKIKYSYQFVIKECKNINPLPFDFAIYENDQLKCLIEFDGKHHFVPVEQFGGEEYLKQVKLHDHIKNEYCKANNIPLYRIYFINYKNIEKILKGILLDNDKKIMNKYIAT